VLSIRHFRNTVVLTIPLILFCSALEGSEPQPASAEDLLIVNCLLPGQVRQLGQNLTYVSPRTPRRTTAFDCRVKGGEYPIEMRQSLGASLKVWQRAAQEGDAEAQTILGEIYERGVSGQPDYRSAALWYSKAAQQGVARASVNLGHLYETGQGVEQSLDRGVSLYRQAAGPEAEVVLETVLASDSVIESKRSQFAGPEIVIIEPTVKDFTRGLVKTTFSTTTESHRIIGRVAAPAGLFSLSVNGTPTEVNSAGLFQAQIKGMESQSPQVLISAIDNLGKKAEVRITDELPSNNKNNISDRDKEALPIQVLRKEFGRYHALLIGNNNYRHLPDLVTPVGDITRIDRTLRGNYGFTTTVLTDANRYEILSALNNLRAELTSDDNLMIYYAGHGELESANMRGHWLPVDAEPANTANWLSNVDITDILNVIQARQVMLVADSCYSGTLTRSSMSQLNTSMTDQERTTWLRLMATKRSRVVLSSGGVAPVLDLGGGKHSVFARAFAETLEANSEVLPGRSLHQAVAAKVAHAASRFEFEQIPQYAPLSRAGHEAGDFFLFADNSKPAR